MILRCLLILFLSIPFMIFSQDLNKHKWNNRILLVISNGSNFENLPKLYEKQLGSLNHVIDGLIDRKIVIYKVFPKEYQSVNLKKEQEPEWIQNSTLFENYNNDNSRFKVVLIGLNGAVKEQRENPITSQELFTIIDGMSMRKSEMRRKNNP